MYGWRPHRLSLVLLTLAACSSEEGGGGTGTPAAIQVSPAADTVIVKANASFSAVVTNADGDTIVDAPVWTVLEPSLATANPNGQISTQGLGSVRVVATIAGVADTATLLIAPGISITPTIGRAMIVGDTLMLGLTFTNALGGAIVASGTPAWSVTSGGATIDTAGGGSSCAYA